MLPKPVANEDEKKKPENFTLWTNTMMLMLEYGIKVKPPIPYQLEKE
jgi:hypothetical protein